MAQTRVKSKRAGARRPSATLAPRDLERERARMRTVLSILKREYPDARCSLDFGSPFQLLVATVLSAQCTDERVNQVTPALFARYPDAMSTSRAPLPEIEKLIQSTGFYKNKARAILETSKVLVEKYGGEVPRTMAELTALRGVGRKTANVILGNAYGVPGLVVDTHVGRLSRRLGFTAQEDPVKVEHELMEVVPREEWTDYGHLMISHGRAICTARRAYCERCPLARYCPKIGVATPSDLDQPRSGVARSRAARAGKRKAGTRKAR